MLRRLLPLVLMLAACGGPAASSTPASTPEPSPNSEAGTIEIGLAISDDRLEITAPAATISRAYSGIVWFVATFREAPSGTSLTATMTRNPDAESTVTWTQPLPIADPQSLTLTDGRSLAELGALQPGEYVLRVLRDGAVLAEGSFEVN